MRVTRRALLRQVAPALALLVAVRPVLAAAPITIVVPYPPGGASDHVARLIAPGLAKSLGEARLSLARYRDRVGSGGCEG